ncbi:MAG: 4-hydroxythreonine-4-phosphate dehydrogenase PdxA [Gemmatimonadales bacterium]|nr:MAG: 4-hydroxythreonine-4-phosphate dehydrogenase PdxA [Gemmatimonadales bacterium]
MTSRPGLAVTLGDPRGIGPELTRRALPQLRASHPDLTVLLLGDEVALRGDWGPGVETQPVGRFDGSPESAGRLSVEAIRTGVDLCLAGTTAALVTGPVHKPSLHAAGTFVPGQTELLQELTGAADVGMLMNAESTRLGPHALRILLATTHLPLREVPEFLTVERLEAQILLLDRSLRGHWGMERPRLALCGMNPHASDGGLFGDEEERVMGPALERARARGVSVAGPLPADTIFLKAVAGELDAVISPTHDVGMAVFKTLAFGRGVNVTLGLPFLRTSPDHGTAFDLVGTGRADPGSTVEAMRLAAGF